MVSSSSPVLRQQAHVSGLPQPATMTVQDTGCASPRETVRINNQGGRSTCELLPTNQWASLPA